MVVTPGMVELGDRAGGGATPTFARAATAERGLQLVHRGPHEPDGAARPGTRPDPVFWQSRPGRGRDVCRAGWAAGDVVLYENDLPDHYP